MTRDANSFNEAVGWLHNDFQQNPFQYGNEDPIRPELYRRLCHSLSSTRVDVEYERDYGDFDQWRVAEIHDRIDQTGRASRVRVEMSFIHEGERWRTRERQTAKQFDLVVFEDATLKMQSKAEGPGNYCDSSNRVSVLCEIKHSKNESDNLYAENGGAGDIIALSQYPGEVEHRVFVFLDWWPRYKRGDKRYERHFGKLAENVEGELDQPVETVYVPRTGELRRETLR